jgi:hypothetical protein
VEGILVQTLFLYAVEKKMICIAVRKMFFHKVRALALNGLHDLNIDSIESYLRILESLGNEIASAISTIDQLAGATDNISLLPFE